MADQRHRRRSSRQRAMSTASARRRQLGRKTGDCPWRVHICAAMRQCQMSAKIAEASLAAVEDRSALEQQPERMRRVRRRASQRAASVLRRAARDGGGDTPSAVGDISDARARIGFDRGPGQLAKKLKSELLIYLS